MRPSLKLSTWRIFQAANDYERSHLAILNGPLPKNDPQLFKPTQVRCLRPFCVQGKRIEVDTILTMPWHSARDMRSLGKIEILEES